MISNLLLLQINEELARKLKCSICCDQLTASIRVASGYTDMENCRYVGRDLCLLVAVVLFAVFA